MNSNLQPASQAEWDSHNSEATVSAEERRPLRYRVLGGYREIPGGRFVPLLDPRPRFCPKCAQQGVPIPALSACPHWLNGGF